MLCVGRVRDHALMYVSPQEIPETLTRDQLRHRFAATTAGIKEPWILVVDCAGANPTQLLAAKRVSDVLRADYSTHIRETWLMNASGILRGFLGFFTSAPGEAEAITFLETERLGLFVQLQRAGCSSSIVDWFLQKLA